MSELTQCNYCTLQDIRRRAKKENKRILIFPSRRMISGHDVYVFPKNVSKENILKSKKLRDKYFAAWFWEIGSTCCC